MPRTPQTLAAALQHVAPIKLDLAPSQKDRPSKTNWWLLRNPRSKDPPHDRAKFTVTRWAADALFVRWGVEKGRVPGRVARERNPARIMTPEWPWHRVLGGLLAGGLLPTLDAVQATTTNPLLLRLDAHKSKQRESWVWQILPGGTLVFQTTTRQEARPILNDLQFVRDLATLAALLPQTRAYDGVWLDLYFGRAYPDDPPVSPQAIFEETLRPWVSRL